MEQSTVLRGIRGVVIDGACVGAGVEKKGGVERVGRQRMRDFVDEVACFAWLIEAVRVFSDREVFVTMACVEVGVLLEGGLGSCDGIVACDGGVMGSCMLETMA